MGYHDYPKTGPVYDYDDLTAPTVRGRVVVVGLHALGTRVPLHMMGFSMYNLTLLACLGYSPSRDLPPLVDLVATGRLDPSRIVSRAFPLEEVNEAYAALEGGEVARAIVQVR